MYSAIKHEEISPLGLIGLSDIKKGIYVYCIAKFARIPISSKSKTFLRYY